MRKLSKAAERLKEIKETIKQEWKNMPEYKFTGEKPIRTLTIKFETIDDLEAFEKLFGQKIVEGRNTYWYPERHESLFSDLVYVDEDKKDES
jgi:hypothetical protein